MGRNAKRRSRGGSAGVPGKLWLENSSYISLEQLHRILLMHTISVFPASKRRRTEWTDSPFGRSVESAGIVLSDGSEPNKLSELCSNTWVRNCVSQQHGLCILDAVNIFHAGVEPAIFQKKLATFFKRCPNLDEVSIICRGYMYMSTS